MKKIISVCLVFVYVQVRSMVANGIGNCEKEMTKIVRGIGFIFAEVA